jgi:type IV secretion system protein TrbE
MYLRPYKMSTFRQRGALLSELCPWVIMADEGIVLLKNGALSCSYEFIAPDLGSAAPAKFAAISNSFNNALLMLGDGWSVQFELQRELTGQYPGAKFSNLAGFMIERQREINFSYTQKHFENRYYMTFTKELPSEIEQKSAGLFYKRSALYESLDRGLIENEIKNFKMVTSKTADILASYMSVKRLGSNDLFGYLHSSVSLDWHKMALPDDCKLFLDQAVIDMSLENSMPLKLGDYYIPIIAVAAFPSMTMPAMFDALNRADIPLRWSTRFTTCSKDSALKRIEKAEKIFHSKRKSLGQWVMESLMHVESTRENSGAYAQESDSSRANAECTMGNIGFGDYCSNIMIWNKDYDKAEEDANYISGLVSSCGFTCLEETHNALQAFLSMQPGNVYANPRQLFVSSGNLSHVIPISSVWSGLKQNKFLSEISGEGRPQVICSTKYGIPYFLNFNHGDVGHHWVSGQTGAGKSTYLALCEVQWLKYPGAKVIIFDKDRSARNLTMCVGGTYIEPGNDDIAFQPLAELDTEEDQRWAAEFIECLLTEQHLDITATVRKAVFDTIKILASKKKETRDLTSFQQYCEGLYQNPSTGRNDITESLSPYVLGGQYGTLFDSRLTRLPFSFWTMIEMGTLMKMSQGAVAPALMFLFRQCEKLFDGKPVLLVLDEAWLFLKNPTFAAKIAEWLKVLRKSHVFVVFATQEINDAASCPIASTIISQCASKVYLADDQAETSMVHDSYVKFGLDESEIELIAKSQKKRDYFFKSPLGTRLFQLDLDTLQLGILTSSIEEQKMLDNIEREYGKNTGKPLVEQILKAKGIKYDYLLRGSNNAKKSA